MSDKIRRDVTRNPDGSETVRTSFTVDAVRAVHDDSVVAIDAALGALGGEVLHAMDPSRILPFSHGGPPVWSVGIVKLPAYTLLVTYGFSHEVSPEPGRASVHHEYSLAVPHGTPLQPWADAFLRHQTRYILTQGADIRVNDCIPLNGIPMTRIPFQPQHHAGMPDSTLVGVLCTSDPVLPAIATPHGTIEVRRLVGIDALELDRVETWSARGFLEELRRRDPLLLSPLQRASWMADAQFRAVVDGRAAKEGSEIDSAMFERSWALTDQGVVIELPQGRGADRLRAAIFGRVGFGRRLGAFSRRSPMIAFEPEGSGVEVLDRALVIRGNLDAPAVRGLLWALQAGDARVVFR